jgi:hypothetical protein
MNLRRELAPLPATALYVQLISELRRLILDRCWIVQRPGDPGPVTFRLRALDERPPVECMSWQKVQAAIDAFFPAGCEVAIRPADGAMLAPVSIAVSMARGSREAGRQMAVVRIAKLPPSRRSRTARAAAQARWHRARVAED